MQFRLFENIERQLNYGKVAKFIYILNRKLDYLLLFYKKQQKNLLFVFNFTVLAKFQKSDIIFLQK